jgi:hypothetical protein
MNYFCTVASRCVVCVLGFHQSLLHTLYTGIQVIVNVVVQYVVLQH